MEIYNHISLTEDELIECLIWGKRKKEEMLRKEALRQKEEANRRLAKSTMDFNVIKTFMFNRAKEIFKYPFELDEDNEMIFDLLCYYFTGNEEGFFRQNELIAKKDEKLLIKNPSINKGILLVGNVGTGKTDLMKLFAKNTRMVYYMRESKRIAKEYVENKDIPEDYIEPFKLAINDPQTFYQPLAGMCIDEMGGEETKNSYGNKANVIADLIEARYNKKYTGLFLHATSNLTSEQFKQYYGERVVSRMRQIFNFVKLPGNDRRK